MSAQVSYLAGSWLLVVAGDGFLLLSAAVPDTMLRQVHNDLDAGISVRDVLKQVAGAGFATQVAGAATADSSGWTLWSLGALSVSVDGRAIATPDSLPLHISAQTPDFGKPSSIPVLQLAATGKQAAAGLEHQRWLPLASGIAWCDALRIGIPAAHPAAGNGPGAGATAADLIGSPTLPVFRSRLQEPRARLLDTSRRPDTGSLPGAGTAPAESAGVLRTNGRETHPGDATIVRSQRAELRSAPSVRALICQSAHPNPPESHSCRVCGQPLTNTRVTRISRPPLGVLRLVQGAPDAPDSIVIDEDLILGSAPAVPASADLPRHIQVSSASSGISARHLHVGLEGWHVLVSDLGSGTGTTIQTPGTKPILLATRHPTLITPNTVIVLGKSLSYRFEVSQ